MKKQFTLLLFFVLVSLTVQAEDGYRLWLRYDKLTSEQQLAKYQQLLQHWMVVGDSPTLAAAKKEVQLGLSGLLGQAVPEAKAVHTDGTLVIGKYDKSTALGELNLADKLNQLNSEGFLILSTTLNKKKVTVITAKEEVGVLYGVFHFLRLLQTLQPIENLDIQSSPKVQIRLLNHWDNIDRTVERGYAGFSIWDWHKLPDYIDPRYVEYARANASIGINGLTPTNVNANALILTPAYLEKVAALADVFRPYGIKMYLTARFSAPIEIGGLKTADPLNEDVQKWWKEKVNEIYTYIPDFGGFLVKANSEGQPGPQNYNRSHAEGANLLADAVAPHGGVVMWRAFVYSNEEPEDRAKQAYNEFKPLEGTFRKNVLIQVKNGAIDFQPREPFHPMFGAFPQTPLMMEFQITQEYLGQATNLAYLAPMWKEVLDSDTYAKGEGSTVAKVIDGSLHGYAVTGMAGVSNIGNERNWTGHLFGQANWYAFGRLAWNYELTSESIADEWARMTFSNDPAVVQTVRTMLVNSYETVVSYMTPLGLHHIMGGNHHYGPAPWINTMPRGDWNSVYYHKADSLGIGFDRTATGSDAVSQYFSPVAEKFASRDAIPEKFLLWFHHVPWDYQTDSGRTLWDAIALKYQEGVDGVRQLQKSWNSLEDKIDPERFQHVKMLLTIQEKEAVWWRDACLSYFQTFSKRPLPEGVEKPEHELNYYQELDFRYAPGIRPRW